MVAEVGASISVLDRVLAVIGLIRENRKQKIERTDNALYALYTALNETNEYVEQLNLGKKRNRKTEYAIAKLWHNASIPLRTIDRDLAERCFIKGGYWLEPDTWSDLQIGKKRIKLSQVFKSTRKLLLES